MTWEEYLFKQHSRETMIKWARSMRYFRIFRAHGGMNNDGDSLDVAIRYEGERAFKKILFNLGISPKIHSSEPPQPIRGKSYSNEEMSLFPSLIKGFQYIEQPTWQVIGGVKVFIWCEESLIKISKNGSLGNGYWLCQSDIDEAVLIEGKFKQFEADLIDPPEKIRNYFCESNYPELFQ